MKKKISFISSRNNFVIGQILILIVGILGVSLVMLFHYQAGVLGVFSARLNATAESIAAELRSNQAPSVPASEEYRIFIVNANDGAIIVDRQSGNEADHDLWESRRAKFVYEMQKQKRGWITYPQRSGWAWTQNQKLIRYVPIEEMGWILAVETSQPSGYALLKDVVNASSCGIIFLIISSGALGLWLLTRSYLDRFEKSVAHSVENNLLSSRGEENLWDNSNSPLVPPDRDANLDKEMMGMAFEPVVTKPKVQEPKPEDGIVSKNPVKEIGLEGIVQRNDKGEAALEKKAVPLKDEHPVMKTYKSPPKEAQAPLHVDENQPVSESAIDVNGIKSSALKKMIQQMRGR